MATITAKLFNNVKEYTADVVLGKKKNSIRTKHTYSHAEALINLGIPIADLMGLLFAIEVVKAVRVRGNEVLVQIFDSKTFDPEIDTIVEKWINEQEAKSVKVLPI